MATITGTQANDVGAKALVGGASSDTLSGLGGSDELFGRAGSDMLLGGDGDDVLDGGAGADLLSGGAGSDTASYASATAAVSVEMYKPLKNKGDAQGDVYVSVENLRGSNFNDTLVGDQGGNSIYGGTGNDNIGGQGGADWIFGEEGDDSIEGQGGNDRIEGGRGNDRLSGGSGGRDTFIFKGDWNVDVIVDYEAGVDEIEFRGGGPRTGAYSVSQIGADSLINAAGGTILVLNTKVADLIIRADPPVATDPVIDLMLSAINIAENSPNGSVVGTLSTTTTGTNTSFTYALLDNAQGRFALQGAVVIATGSNLNYEAATSHNITIKVTDGNGFAHTETLAIAVQDRNEAPTAITVSNQQAVAENTAVETKLADIAVVDPDTGTAFRDNTVTVNDARFTIKNGGLYLKAGQVVDFEATPTIPLTLTASSSVGSVTKIITLAVNNVDDTATVLDLSLSAAQIAENSPNGAVVGTLSTTTTGSNTSFTYQLVDSAQGRFALQGASLVATGTNLNYEAATSHSVTIKSTDANGASVTETLQIAVQDRNEAPTGITISNQQSVTENTAVETKLADLVVVDPDTGAPFLDNTLLVSDARFTIKNGGLYLKAGQVVDFEATPTIDLTLTASSSAGSFSKGLTLTVANVDETGPVLDLSLSASQIAENSANGAVVGTLSTSTTGSNTNFTYQLVDNAQGRFALQGTSLIATGVNLDYEAASTHSVIIKSTDGNGASVTETLQISVQDRNDAPSGLTVANLQAITENTAIETKLADVAVIDADANLAFRDNAITVSDPRFEVKNGGLYLKAGQVVDYEAGAIISLTLTATSSVGSVGQVVNLTVNDVNESAPTLDLSLSSSQIAENSASGSVVGTLSTTTTGSNTAFTYSLVDSAQGRFSLQGSTLVATGSNLNYEAATSHSVTIKSTDGNGASVTETLQISVQDRNEAPTGLTVSNLQAVAENTSAETKLADLTVLDPDQSLAFQDNVISVDDGRFLIKNGGLYLKAGQAIDYEATPSISLTLTVSSSVGSVTKVVTVAVTDVNEGGQPALYLLDRAGTTTPLSVDLTQANQTLADGTVLNNVQRIDFRGGEGGDTVYGGAYDDLLAGNGGTDLLEGRGGNDQISGGAGDTLKGGEGSDVLSVSGAATLADGGAGIDRLKVTGAATFAAGAIIGVESVEVARGLSVNFSNLTDGLTIAAATEGSSGVTITGTRGNDAITGTASADIIDGSNGHDIIRGGGGNDRLTSGPGTDFLYGEDGDDTLESKRGTGPDNFDGGAGSDRVVVDLAKSAVDLKVDLSNPAIKQLIGDGSSIINVEQITITGGTGADIFTGGALADGLGGYDGDDILKGGGGNDSINGGEGYDIAVFSGPSTNYTIAQQSDGSYKVTSAAEGVDTLISIETLRFSDGERPIDILSTTAAYWGTTAGSATLITSTPLPDGRGAAAGTGFTITGLAQAGDGTWWASNEGQANSSDTTYTPSLVHLSEDLTTKIGEINLPGAVRAIQGVAYKQATNEIFVGSLSERLVRVYSPDGTFLRSFAPTTGTSVNGLAYDSALDAVVIGHEAGNPANTTVEWRSATTGALIKTMAIAVPPDQLFVDPADGEDGALYYTFGDSGVGRIGYVVKVDIATGAELGRYVLSDADAIEGVVIVDKGMWVANDGFFHTGEPPTNAVLEYEITPIAYVLDVRDTSAGLTVDLNVHDQVLSNGTHLVGVERMFFHGGSGADQVTGGAYNDVLVGGGGGDGLTGDGGDDRLVGLTGDDILVGGPGNDILDGGTGSDRLEGGAGNDLLTAGRGEADRFAFRAGAWGTDHVADFESGLDILDFQGSGVALANLVIAQQGEDTIITAAGHGVIILDDVVASALNTSNWLF